MPVDLQEKKFATTIDKEAPARRRREGTDGDPPRIMFKGLGGRYAGGGMPARDKALYVGGGIFGTAALFVLVYWMITLF